VVAVSAVNAVREVLCSFCTFCDNVLSFPKMKLCNVHHFVEMKQQLNVARKQFAKTAALMFVSKMAVE